MQIAQMVETRFSHQAAARLNHCISSLGNAMLHRPHLRGHSAFSDTRIRHLALTEAHFQPWLYMILLMK